MHPDNLSARPELQATSAPVEVHLQPGITLVDRQHGNKYLLGFKNERWELQCLRTGDVIELVSGKGARETPATALLRMARVKLDSGRVTPASTIE